MWKIRSKVKGIDLGVTFLKDSDSNELEFANKEQAETAAKKMSDEMNLKGYPRTWLYWAVRV